MFLADADISQALADMYRTTTGALPSQLTNVVAQAHTAAYQDILSGLLARGFSLAQISLWDRGAEFERMLSLYWVLVNSGENVNYGPLVKNYDRRQDLKTVLLSIAGVYQAPAAADTPGDIGSGDFDTGRDVQDYNTIDPRTPTDSGWDTNNPWD